MTEVIELAGIILVDEDGHIALQLRDDNPKIANPGKWSVFGGHIEAGEAPAKAAIREAYEELTITLRPEKLAFLGKFPYQNKLFYIYRYVISDEMATVELKEGQDWRWCTRAEIASLEIDGRPVVDYHTEFFERLWEQN